MRDCGKGHIESNYNGFCMNARKGVPLNELMKLCVFTPTYNRAYTLPRLYESLKKQTSNQFEWVVVDDGSTDNTEDLISSYIREEEVEIKYIRTQNGGKQRAHNVGVERCDCPVFMCVDSDDYLVPDAVECLLREWGMVKDDQAVSGILFRKGFLDGKSPNTPFPDGIEYATLRELYSKYRFRGDMGLMYRTDILEKYPFWVAPGEKFMGESYVYDQIDQHYVMRLLDRMLYVAEYLPDGYTRNVRKVTRENPIGYLTLKRQSVVFGRTLYEKYRDTVLYLVGCILAKRRRGVVDAPLPVLAFFAYVPAKIVRYLFFR